MLVRLVGVALSLALLLSSCGQGAYGGYGSIQDVAKALNCHPTGAPEDHPRGGYTVLTCAFRGHQLAIYWMDGGAVSYPGMPWARDELFGKGRWNVECTSHADCVKVQRIIGGEFGQRPKED